MSFIYNIFDNNRLEVLFTSNKTKTFYPKMSKRKVSKNRKVPKMKINNRNNIQKRTLRY